MSGDARADSVMRAAAPGAGETRSLSGELLVVAVEASADLHGAAVLRELKLMAPGLRAFGAAGPLMRAEGCEALVRAETLGVMGLVEVLPAIPRLLRALSTLATAARKRRPRLALLIDSPDFNLRLARRLKRVNVPVAYFIGPSVWAWRTYRVRQIARDILRMLVILPFERAFYAEHGVEAIYVGNPLADRLAVDQDGLHTNHRDSLDDDTRARPARKRELGLDPARPLLALLPGSRKQEIARLWKPLLGAAQLLAARDPSLQFAVPVAPTIDLAALRDSARDAKLPLAFLEGRAPELLAASDAAVVASGTATLESALQLCPTVVVYRLSWLSYAIARMLVRVKFIALPNLLAQRGIVPELIQAACTPETIAESAQTLLARGGVREGMRAALLAVRDEIAPAGAANVARRVAEEISGLLTGESVIR